MAADFTFLAIDPSLLSAQCSSSGPTKADFSDGL